MTDAGPLDLINDSDDESDGKNLSLPAARKGRMTLRPRADLQRPKIDDSHALFL
jgi:hypothetical protein